MKQARSFPINSNKLNKFRYLENKKNNFLNQIKLKDDIKFQNPLFESMFIKCLYEFDNIKNPSLILNFDCCILKSNDKAKNIFNGIINFQSIVFIDQIYTFNIFLLEMILNEDYIAKLILELFINENFYNALLEIKCFKSETNQISWFLITILEIYDKVENRKLNDTNFICNNQHGKNKLCFEMETIEDNFFNLINMLFYYREDAILYLDYEGIIFWKNLFFKKIFENFDFPLYSKIINDNFFQNFVEILSKFSILNEFNKLDCILGIKIGDEKILKINIRRIYYNINLITHGYLMIIKVISK
jgi:hypothetical protein